MMYKIHLYWKKINKEIFDKMYNFLNIYTTFKHSKLNVLSVGIFAILEYQILRHFTQTISLL